MRDEHPPLELDGVIGTDSGHDLKSGSVSGEDAGVLRALAALDSAAGRAAVRGGARGGAAAVRVGAAESRGEALKQS